MSTSHQLTVRHSGEDFPVAGDRTSSPRPGGRGVVGLPERLIPIDELKAILLHPSTSYQVRDETLAQFVQVMHPTGCIGGPPRPLPRRFGVGHRCRRRRRVARAR
jgi:hypothetical protein